MEPEINCSDLCDSLPGQELDRRPIHDLCKTTIVSKQPRGVRAAQKYMCCGERGVVEEEMLMKDMHFQALVMMGQFTFDLQKNLIPNSFSLFCSQTSSHHSKTISSLSPALVGIVWTFLSCGLLLIVFFLGFTIRCRKNR